MLPGRYPPDTPANSAAGYPSGVEKSLPEASEMRRYPPQPSPRYLGRIGTMLFAAAFFLGAEASQFKFGYSNSHYYPYGFHDNFRLRREIDHLGDQVKRQQRRLNEQNRLQREQTRLLKQQQSNQLQTTGRQACYYRLDGGLDLCDRLFGSASTEHAACIETAKEINAGCAEDLMRPAHNAGN